MTAAAKPDIRVYQIFYDEASRQQLLPGFLPLDNTRNERPDWFEFWVMLHFLRHNTLQDNTWYGFVSPKFQQKTGMTGQAALAHIEAHAESADVMLFTEGWDQIAYFLNPWEQGEIWHPGLTALTQRFLHRVGLNVDLQSLVVDSHACGFSNFVVAKKAYWVRWQALAERFFALLEGPDAQAQGFADVTHYGTVKTHYPMKTFIQERLMSVILALGQWRVVPQPVTDEEPINGMLFRRDLQTRRLLQTCDLMKSRYRQTADPAYLDMYWRVRREVAYTAPRLLS